MYFTNIANLRNDHIRVTLSTTEEVDWYHVI